MPIAPYTWKISDWLTASRLNGELYRYLGQPFSPNGIGFHAAKPIYKTIPNAQAATSGWVNTVGLGGALSTVSTFDTAAFFGTRSDPGAFGWLKTVVANAGGLVNTAGGLGLVSFFGPGTGSSGGDIRAGIGLSTNSGPTVTGTSQPGNTSKTNCAWALDLTDLNPNPGAAGGITGFFQNNQTGGGLNSPNADGSGVSPRLQAFWASVYPANGTKITSLPSLIAPGSVTSNTPALNAALFNANIANLMNLLNMPPVLRVVSTSTTSCPSGSFTKINFPAATYDTYGGWSNSNNQYTIPLDGLYLIAGFVPWDAIGNTDVKTEIQISGNANNNFVGPVVPATAGNVSCGGKIGIFDLRKGDIVNLAGYQNSGSTQNTASSTGSVFVILYVGAIGAPTPLPTVPDPNFWFQAGSAASAIPGLLNAHLVNDTNFLYQRPYLLSYQQTVQTGLTVGNDVAITMDTVAGIYRGSVGDNYSGWDSVNKRYVAPVQGYYLCVNEVFADVPGGSGGTIVAEFKLGTTGSVGTDLYQQTNTTTNFGSGGSALGIYYLRVGDTIAPWANLTSGGATWSTYQNPNVNSHFELIWLGM